MIFAKTIDLAMSSAKTQTCRLQHPGDRLETLTINTPKSLTDYLRVVDRDGRPRWTVGRLYSIQKERCHHAKGYFRCTYLRAVPDPMAVDVAFAKAEGFDTLEGFLAVWRELHGKNIHAPCWAVGIELVSRVVKRNGRMVPWPEEPKAVAVDAGAKLFGGDVDSPEAEQVERGLAAAVAGREAMRRVVVEAQ